MSKEKLVSSWVRVVFSPLSDDFLLTAGQRLYKPARISIKKQIKLMLCSLTATFDSLHKAGCICRSDHDLHCNSAAASSCYRSDRTQHTGVFLLICFMGGCNPSQKNKVTFIRK